MRYEDICTTRKGLGMPMMGYEGDWGDDVALVQPRLRHKAAVAAVLYIARRVTQPDRFRLGHLLYLADKLHLEEYGRTISGERYHAMRHGPVPSAIYDVLKALSGDGSHYHLNWRIAEGLRGSLRHLEGPNFEAVGDPDMGVLSDSDVEALDAVIMGFGSARMEEIEHATHDAAWTRVWETRPNAAIPWEAIADTLHDSEAVLEQLHEPHPG